MDTTAVPTRSETPLARALAGQVAILGVISLTLVAVPFAVTYLPWPVLIAAGSVAVWVLARPGRCRT